MKKEALMPSTGWTSGESVRQLPLDLGGLSLDGETNATLAYQAAVTTLDESIDSPILNWIRSLSRGDLVAVSRPLDDVPKLLGAIGADPLFVDLDEPDFSGAKVAFVGCPHRETRLDAERTQQFLEHGGVLVTSDKAVNLPVLRELLPAAKPMSPRRVRVTWNTVQLHGWRSSKDLSPAVTLDAGHVPLAPVIDREAGAQIITHDRLSGDPLAVVLRAGNGAVVHSVPHWFQEEYVQRNTELETRPLSSVSHYAGLADAYPGLSLGLYRAAETMLMTMLVGLDVAFSVASAYRHREAS